MFDECTMCVEFLKPIAKTVNLMQGGDTPCSVWGQVKHY